MTPGAAMRDAFPHSRTAAENLVRPDFVLVQAPGWGVNNPPLATAMLTSFARSRGYRVLPLDLNIEFYQTRPAEYADRWQMEQSLWFWCTRDCVRNMLAAYSRMVDAFVEIVLATEAPVVGFTVYASSLLVTLELAKQLKARRPELVIVLGGPHVSRDIAGRDVILDPAVDAVVQGEGEMTLVDVLERFKAQRGLDSCPGLLLQLGGSVVETGDRELIRNLDDLPMPDFSDYSFQAYRLPNRLPIMGGRGCPNRCIYCNERPFWKRFRFRSAESIFAEISSQMRLLGTIDFIDFQDSLVNGKIRELERLADLIIESGLKLEWAGQAVIRKEMSLGLMAKLKRSGCVCLAYGLETLSRNVMDSIGKVLSKGADIDAIAQAHGRSGVGAVYNVMFGLPGETEEDAFSMLEFLRRNQKLGIVVNPSPSFCGLSPGTEAFAHPDRFGLDLTKGALYWQSTNGDNTYVTRLKRFEDFCRLVAELGIETTYPATRLLDRNRSLGQYYDLSGDWRRAEIYYQAWLEEHPEDQDIRNSLEKILVSHRESVSAPIVYPLQSCTDQNWQNGIARGWAAAFFVPHTEAAVRDMRVGWNVVFVDGSSRRIVSTKENEGSLIVFLDGPPLDGGQVGHPATVRVGRSTSPGESQKNGRNADVGEGAREEHL